LDRILVFTLDVNLITACEALCNAVIAFLDAKKEANDEEK